MNQLDEIQKTVSRLEEELISVNNALIQIARNLVSLRKELGASKTPELTSNVEKTLDQKTVY